MAQEFGISSVDDLFNISGYVHDHFESGGKPLKAVFTTKNNGTLPMLKVWRMWMADITRHHLSRKSTMPLYYDMDGNPVGSRPFNENDAHEAYTHLCLGSDERGVRYSWAIYVDNFEGRKVASIERKFHAMQKFHQHCMEYGIKIRIPERSEYQELQDKQNR